MEEISRMTVPNYIWLLLSLLALAALVATALAIAKGMEAKRLRASAFHDTGTAALTAAGFGRAVKKILASEAESYTLVTMRPENIEVIRATFGPKEGERTMAYLADLLARSLSAGEPCGRMGAGLLAFLLKNRSSDEVRSRLGRLSDEAAKGIRAVGKDYTLNLTFGAYRPVKGETSVGEMVGRADISCTMGQSGQRYHFYDDDFTDALRHEAEVAQAMDKALALQEFQLHFQPKVRLADGRVMGAEALIRWRHPQKGLLTPDMFLPTAEKYQKTKAIDRFAFTAVCRALARWDKQGREICPISLNLSAANLADPDFVDECCDVCRSFGVKSENIEFEIDEGLLLQDMDRSRTFTRRLRAQGFRFSVDHFGADASALRLLSDLQPDAVKLSRAFFSGEADNRSGRYVVESLLRLAAQLHITSVAEGVDSPAQAEYLRGAACDMVQGFCFFKPMAPERFESEAFKGAALRLVEMPAVQHKTLAHAKGGETPIIHFAYLSGEDTVVFESEFSPILTGTRFEDARALFRTSELIHENDRPDFLMLLDRALKETGWVENTLRFYMNKVGYEWLQIRACCADKRSGVVSGSLVNVAGWLGEVDRWKEKAIRDALTGLFNREHFERALRTGLESGALSSAGLVFIDVDDFKNVNDSYGHMFGDDVLCYVAKRILGTFRHTDVCARFGGDEFVIFAAGITREVLENRLTALCKVFSYPYRNGETECKISISVGGAMYPADGADYETLLDRADSALYEAKNAGKDRYMLYDASMEENAGKRRRDGE